MNRAATLVVLLLLLAGAPAGAWSEDADEPGDGPPAVPVPAAWDLEQPGGLVAESSSVREVLAPEGIYLVTETYLRDTVTVEGSRTTYSTETL